MWLHLNNQATIAAAQKALSAELCCLGIGKGYNGRELNMAAYPISTRVASGRSFRALQEALRTQVGEPEKEEK